jgi:hypothetical protein
MQQITAFDVPAFPSHLSADQRAWCATAHALAIVFDQTTSPAKWLGTPCHQALAAAAVSCLPSPLTADQVFGSLVANGCPDSGESRAAAGRIADMANALYLQLHRRRDEYTIVNGVGRSADWRSLRRRW